MAQANLRLAAGLGAVAACLLVGGAGTAVAVADSGGGHWGHPGNGSRGGSNANDTTVNTISTNTVGTVSTNTSSRTSSKLVSSRDVATPAQRPNSSYSPGSPQFKAPKVRFGDGRNPDVQRHDSRPVRHGPAAAPAPPQPPQAITVPLNPPTLEPAREQHRFVDQLVTEPMGGLADPLWGVAGLLLIPTAGAILGYRQARAARLAAELGRHP